MKRRAGGFIKDCHGDLHLDHVHVKDGVVNIYDCIEFNERFRYIDVANDVAFLAMDLDHHGRTDLSKTFARNMASRLNDNDLPKLLPFYKCYRAIVRGKVAGMRGMEAEIPADDRRQAIDEGRSYYRQALGYAVTNDRPTVVVVMGGVGTGKSSQANALAYNLGWETFSSDVIRKTRAGASLHERTPEAHRDELYHSDETDRVYDELASQAVSSVKNGKSCILDATYGSLKRRNRLRGLLKREGIEYRFIEVTAPEDLILQRLSEREQKDDVVSDARLDDYEMLHSAFESPSALEDEFHFCVSSEGSADSTISHILKALVQLS
ncbi:MAG: AAA family ATPase [Rhodothermales bacterium]|nr:AAA family ATPase [Rhodothermales bacterium]